MDLSTPNQRSKFKNAVRFLKIKKHLFQGLEKSWADHKACSELLYNGLEKLGLELLVKNKVPI